MFADFWGNWKETNTPKDNLDVKPRAIAPNKQLIDYASQVMYANSMHSRKYVLLAKKLVTIITTPPSQWMEI